MAESYHMCFCERLLFKCCWCFGAVVAMGKVKPAPAKPVEKEDPEEEEEEEPEANLHGLGDRLGNDEVVRARLLKDGTLFGWPSEKTVGIINFKTTAQNVRVLTHLVEVWCPQMSEAKTIYVPHAREQVQC